MTDVLLCVVLFGLVVTASFLVESYSLVWWLLSAANLIVGVLGGHAQSRHRRRARDEERWRRLGEMQAWYEARMRKGS